MQDFVTEEDVQAWVMSQPHGMGRLKLSLMVSEQRLSERGLAAARNWLAEGARGVQPANTTAPGAVAPRSRRWGFNWLQAITVILLLALAGYLAVQLAHVAGRT